MKPFRYFAIFTAFLAVVGLLAAGVFLSIVCGIIGENRVAYGVKYSGIPLAGMTRAAARDAIEASIKEKCKVPALILLEPDDMRTGHVREWDISADEIGITTDADAMADRAYGIGRVGSLPSRLVTLVECALDGRDISLTSGLDEEKMNKAIKKVADEVYVAPRDAWVSFDGGVIAVHAGVTGKRLDVESITNGLAPHLKALDLPQKREVNILLTEPHIRTQDVAPIDSVLSTYTTHYAGGTDRGDNIEIAAHELYGVIVKSGEEFSFNDTVGSRVPAAGYQPAPVIIDGKEEIDYGGGVCQVSSTLYNAILLADLTSTSRTAHFYPSFYVPAGLDATVADGVVDFTFRNDLPHAVMLVSYASAGEITIDVLGHAADVPYDISLDTEQLDARPTVKAYRTYRDSSGNIISRETLHTDEYSVESESQE